MEPDLQKLKSWIYKCIHETSQNTSPEIEEFTDDFLKEIQCIFKYYLKAFNEIKQETNIDSSKDFLKHSIFIYKLSETKGFMLFKTNFKLIFSSIKPGQIRIKFLKQKILGEVEILTDTYLNLFYNDMMPVRWIHENKKGFVDKNILVRYYMKRFIQEK
ncbi:MAG: hypothetical protein GDA46_04895 [Bdellovibrionales bacterium]|nr:hypothetical protein [Bdellovibrionales bacterium]